MHTSSEWGWLAPQIVHTVMQGYLKRYLILPVSALNFVRPRVPQTSAHNQVQKVISSYLIRWVGPKWTVHEDIQMGNMGLTLSKVPATVVVTAGKSSGVDAAGECDLKRWQPDWVAISYAHKRIGELSLIF